jgi:molybdopterin molybdotransferase
MSELLARAEALRLVLERVTPPESEEVVLDAAAARVLVEAARSRVDLPPFPASAMDGFAVRAEDLPGALRLAGQITAGGPSRRQLAPGEAMAIATGGVVPAGADTVVALEEAEVDKSVVRVAASHERGEHVRPRGGDLRAGEVVVTAGVRLGPTHVGALAAAGVAAVRCARAPRVVVVVTGSELRVPGEHLRPGEIYDANGVMLVAQARSAGAVAERLPLVADDLASMREALARSLEADVVVTSGGVSVGPADLVRRTAAELGVEEVFWRVALRPGKPLSFGVRGRTLVFGLPGNPVSSLVGFELFVRPALLALQGLAEPEPAFLPGRLARPAAMVVARESLLRARARVTDDGVILDPLDGQESHMIARAAHANALVLVPRGEGALAAGTAVSYLAL